MPYRGANERLSFEVQMEDMDDESHRFDEFRHFDFIMTRTIITFQPKNLSMT